jgi:hypothetical protein
MPHFARSWFLAGLFLTALVTLCIEVLFTRILSVTLWYHLSFFAVSTAMFGMSAGALQVYLSRPDPDVRETLARMHRTCGAMAWTVPFSHLVLLVVLLPKVPSTSTLAISVLTVITVSLAIPFFLSGKVIATALTRVPGRIGLIYAMDLVGAAAGAVLVVPLLSVTNASTAFFLCGAMAALAALCFLRASGARTSWSTVAVAALLAALGVHNATTDDPIRAWFSKGALLGAKERTSERWNIHSHVLVRNALGAGPMYWAPGKGHEAFEAKILGLLIDGEAGTSITKWDGRLESLEWAEYDVTSMPYHVRPGGECAVIGVGGGRDLLTALRFGCDSVTGIEINRILLDLLERDKRDVANLAGRDDVRLVHDEARSYLTRTEQRFDVLQMSLIDTWAATGAGAMTLTENGLYTVEAWDVFLRVLKPRGVFGVSRWHDASSVSETNRLVALAVAALLRRGVADPSANLALVVRDNVATLLTSPDPFSADDLRRIQETVARLEFQWILGPGVVPAEPQLAAIAASKSFEELGRATAHEWYDYSPPTDERPFFFNLLKLEGALSGEAAVRSEGVIYGNLRATGTLVVLFVLSGLLVIGAILVPLARSGLPPMKAGSFALSLAYFVAIGLGYMLVQIPSLQRFSVYLGHPTYALIVILSSMILATGLGSLVSDRLRIEENRRLALALPVGIALAILAATLVLGPLLDATIGAGFAVRAAVVVAWIGPVAFLLGFGFPMGLRLVRRLSPEALPWMWGVNGASSVFAAVLSIAVSMAWGIHANFFAAALLYGSLALVAPALWSRGASSGRNA